MRTLTVEGMSCDGCVRAVTRALAAVPDAGTVRVDLDAGTVSITGTAGEAALRMAIEDAGFSLTGMDG